VGILSAKPTAKDTPPMSQDIKDALVDELADAPQGTRDS